MFVESIRSFAGNLDKSPIRIFTPRIEKEFPASIIKRLNENDVEVVRFEVDPDDLKFPFISEAKAAATAEELALQNDELLIWLTSNTIVLQEPSAFLISPQYYLGYRPVHHRLLGSKWGEPLDGFWSWVYEYCKVPEDRIFQMTGHIDGEQMRPYFNAGSFVVRPEAGILNAWKEAFVEGYRDETLWNLYRQDERYAVFIHQAIFSAVILSKLKRDEIFELPGSYNYPSHLHDDDVTSNKPKTLDECVTIRHEGFYRDTNWYDNMQIRQEIRDWLKERI